MDDLEYRVGKLSLAPGDVLVAKVDTVLSLAQHDYIRQNLSASLPEGVKALVLDSRMDLSILTKADIDARTEGRSR